LSGPLAPAERRPFSPTRSWNPVTGCTHRCTYCWAMRLIETKLKDHPKYRNGFSPTLHPEELSRRFTARTWCSSWTWGTCSARGSLTTG